jgi:hypothetical protein
MLFNVYDEILSKVLKTDVSWMKIHLDNETKFINKELVKNKC